MSLLGIDQNFIGRGKTCELLRRRVFDLKEGYRQNLALLGNRFVGKSTILENFLYNLDDENIISIYCDLENRDFRYFYVKFVTSLLYSYSKSKNLPLHEDLNLLCESTSQHIPHTIQVVRKIQTDFQKGRYNETFLGLLALPEIFTNETEKFCILVFDEFQCFENFPVEDVFQVLGKKIMTQKRCLYVVSSSFEKEAIRILSEKLSLLFGNFEVVMVEPFNFTSSRELIDSKLGSVKIGGQLRNFLMDFTGGHPLYLTLLTRELVNLSAIHNQGEIYKPLLMQAIENTIFDQWGVISRHFELIMNDLCSGKGNQVISSLLIALVDGNSKIDAIIAQTLFKKSTITQKCNRLMELGVVVRNGNFFYVKDRLFKYWIKYVYKKRLRGIELAPDKQKKQFKEELHSAIETFNCSSRKDFSSRIVELLNCFDNEAFDLNGRKYRLPVFTEMSSVRVRSHNGSFFDVIKASTEKAFWVIVPKKDNFAESDVSAIKKEVGRDGGKKPERTLVISSSNIDKNTRLRALQEKFWVWDENELKILVTLFDKPYIT